MIYDTLQTRYNYTEEYIDGLPLEKIIEKFNFAVQRKQEELDEKWRQTVFIAYHSNLEFTVKYEEVLKSMNLLNKNTNVEKESTTPEQALEQGLEIYERYKAQRGDPKK